MPPQNVCYWTSNGHNPLVDLLDDELIADGQKVRRRGSILEASVMCGK